MKQKMQKALIPILVLALTVPSFAQPGKDQMKRGLRKGDLIEALDLTEVQESQIKDLRFSHEKQMINLQAKVKTEKLNLRELKQADEPNKKKIYAQIEKVSNARVEVDKARVDHQLAMRKVLTEEQYKIFRKGMRKAEGRKGQRAEKSPRREHNFRK